MKNTYEPVAEISEAFCLKMKKRIVDTHSPKDVSPFYLSLSLSLSCCNRIKQKHTTANYIYIWVHIYIYMNIFRVKATILTKVCLRVFIVRAWKRQDIRTPQAEKEAKEGILLSLIDWLIMLGLHFILNMNENFFLWKSLR